MAIEWPELYFVYAIDALQPLALFAIGITAYGVFVFHFYRFIARKDILALDLSRHNEARHPFLRKCLSLVFYAFKSLILFPLIVLCWFAVMAGLLFVMSTGESLDALLLTAMGIVAAVRISAYYRESLASDIARILPLGLLSAVLLSGPLSIEYLVLFKEAEHSIYTLQADTLIYYTVGVVLLEFVLRLAHAIASTVKGWATKEDGADRPNGDNDEQENAENAENG